MRPGKDGERVALAIDGTAGSGIRGDLGDDCDATKGGDGEP
jgi:hypothetical protein